MSDFVFMTRDRSKMFVTGPDVVAAVTGESVTLDELGGAAVHATRTGSATYVAEDEQSCLDAVRYLIGLLPSNNQETATPRTTCARSSRRSSTTASTWRSQVSSEGRE